VSRRASPRRPAPDQDALLELLGDVHDLLVLDEFRVGLLVSLRRVVPCDWISFNDVGPDPASTAAVVDPPLPEWTFDAFARHAHENPLVAYYLRTRDGRATRFSDLVTQAQLHELALYRECYGPIGLEYQIAFTLPHTPERVLGVALGRRSHDFSDGERDFLERARPHLIQAYRNAVRYTEAVARADAPRVSPPDARALTALGLTRRQAEVLSLVATGAADREIARRLEVSHRTVAKHLERSYRLLGVASRSEAAGRAWAAAAQAENPPPPGGGRSEPPTPAPAPGARAGARPPATRPR